MTRNRSLVRIALAALVVVGACIVGIIVGGELYAPAPEQREPEGAVRLREVVRADNDMDRARRAQRLEEAV
jgi:hypothetical protein